MKAPQARSFTPLNALGLLGILLWVLTLFLRETSLVDRPVVGFVLGIAPNFGVGLLLPMLMVNLYPAVAGRELTDGLFLSSLVLFFVVLLLSEVVHDLFLGSRFDGYDLVASLMALGIMAWLYLSARRGESKGHGTERERE